MSEPDPNPNPNRPLMLGIKCKKTDPVDFQELLRPFISELNDVIEADLETLKNQRKSAVENPITEVERLISYYKSLTVVEKKFPLFKETNNFTWFDSFEPDKAATNKNIVFEKFSVLFNLAATYSRMGSAKVNKVNDENKEREFASARDAFTRAGSVFSYMNPIQESTVDVSFGCITVLENLMLAQAHHCALETMKPDNEAYASTRNLVCLYYKEAIAALDSPCLKNHIDKDFKNDVQLRANIFHIDNDTTLPETDQTVIIDLLDDDRNVHLFGTAVPADYPVVVNRAQKAIRKRKERLRKDSSDVIMIASKAMPMLALKAKKPGGRNPYGSLSSHLAKSYAQRDISVDISGIKSFRSGCNREVHSNPKSYRAMLLKYYKSICTVQSRFPEFTNTISFTWHNAYKPDKQVTQDNIYLEKAAVLFNLATAYHEIGLSHDLTTFAGRRSASQDFITAASVFSYLMENEVASIKLGTVDLTVECIDMLQHLMLAQAQECVCENFLANRKTTEAVRVKLSMQVALFYDQVLRKLNEPPLKDYFSDEIWRTHVQIKAACFLANASLMHTYENDNDKRSSLNKASLCLTNARESSTKILPVLEEMLNEVEGRLKKTQLVGTGQEIEVRFDTYSFEIPSFSVIEGLRALLEPSHESIYRNQFAIIDDSGDPDAGFTSYSEMVDDIIMEQAAKSKEIDNRVKFSGLKRAREIGKLPQTKRHQPLSEKVAAMKAKVFEASSDANTPEEVMGKLQIKPLLFTNNLSAIQVVLHAQNQGSVAVLSNSTEFAQKLKRAADAFESKKNLDTTRLLLDDLTDHVKKLGNIQELKIVESLDEVYKEMAKLDESIGVNGLQSMFGSGQLEDLHTRFGFFLTLKSGRSFWTEDEIKNMSFSDIRKTLETVYEKEDFRSCETLLSRMRCLLLKARLLP